jgi:GDP-4-dehydro-6-deoxy-D-mannose reductase
MRKILITGISGFVGKHFLNYINSLEEPMEIIGVSRHATPYDNYKNLDLKIIHGDLKNMSFINDILNQHQPNYILHLASDSSVAYSWQKPIDSFLNNTNIFLNLVESVRLNHIDCRILSIGSSEQYGIVNPENLPLSEESPLNPISPYAVARVSQEMLSTIYAKSYGLNIIMTRSFNHIGPGQADKFVVSSFVKQILNKKSNPHLKFEVGDVSIVRDFLDVRDVVNAYWKLLLHGKSGEVYNICNGAGTSLKEIITIILKLTDSNFTFETVEALIRPSDNPIIIGSNKKICSQLNWLPKISMEQSLGDIISYWENDK